MLSWLPNNLKLNDKGNRKLETNAKLMRKTQVKILG